MKIGIGGFVEETLLCHRLFWYFDNYFDPGNWIHILPINVYETTNISSLLPTVCNTKCFELGWLNLQKNWPYFKFTFYLLNKFVPVFLYINTELFLCELFVPGLSQHFEINLGICLVKIKFSSYLFPPHYPLSLSH